VLRPYDAITIWPVAVKFDWTKVQWTKVQLRESRGDDDRNRAYVDGVHALIRDLQDVADQQAMLHRGHLQSFRRWNSVAGDDAGWRRILVVADEFLEARSVQLRGT
jgi:hypothetical protein